MTLRRSDDLLGHYAERRGQACDCKGIVGEVGKCDGACAALEKLQPLVDCDHEGCRRPRLDQQDGSNIFKRCALHEIASYNAEELREWGEENAADMVDAARRQLAQEDPLALIPGVDY